MFIYLIPLEKEKYFVTSCKSGDLTGCQVCDVKGNEWTDKYKPKKVEPEVSPLYDEQSEKKALVHYKKKYGEENVEGTDFKMKSGKCHPSIICKPKEKLAKCGCGGKQKTSYNTDDEL